jgi:NAD(P)-dependent dehydrogenase (short-subunit alcohol dehydrogenase family)
VGVVTGGAGGIGLEIARTIVAGGGAVVIGDLHAERGEQAERELGADAPDRVERLVAIAGDRFGRLDAMFNNAGIGGAIGPITEQTADAWDATFAVNVRSVFLGTKHAARRLIAQGEGGAIVNTASIAGQSGGGGPQAYSATKAAVINLTESTSVELAPHRIRVNAVCPGVVYTELMHRGRPEAADGWRRQIQPWPDRGEADMIADVAVWLAGDGARFVTGATIRADGGTMAATPQLFERQMPHAGSLSGITYGTTGEPPTVRRLP